MKQVNAILIDSKNKEVKKIKFDGRYFSIHNFIGEEVECIDSVQTLLDDCIFYEFPKKKVRVNILFPLVELFIVVMY